MATEFEAVPGGSTTMPAIGENGDDVTPRAVAVCGLETQNKVAS